MSYIELKLIPEETHCLIPPNGLYLQNPEICSYNKDQLVALPILHNTVTILMVGHLATLTFEQEYQNPTNQKILTKFIYPLQNYELFLKFSARLGDKQIVSEIIKKDSVQKGLADMDSHTQQSDNKSRQGLMTIPIAEHMNPQSQSNEKDGKIKILFSYTTPLTISNNIFWVMNLMYKLTPRYINQQYSMKYGSTEHLYYNEYLKVIICHQNKIHLPIFSTTHSIIQSQIKNQGREVIVKLDKKEKLNKHFKLFYTTDFFNEPQQYMGQVNGKKMLIISWVPKFNNFSINQAFEHERKHQTLEVDIGCVKGQYVAIIDRSGSMQGNKIEQTKRSADFLVQHLPKDSTFNIVSFGSDFKPLFPSSQPNNKQNFEEARKSIKQFNADMGGTQLFLPLESIFKQPHDHKYYKYILVFTDGGTSRQEEILSLISQKKSIATVYPIGIGNSVDVDFLNKVEAKGNSKALFIEQKDNYAEKITQLYSYIFKPVISDVKIDWKLDFTQVQSVYPNPKGFQKMEQNQFMNFSIELKGDQIADISHIGNFTSIAGSEGSKPIEIKKNSNAVFQFSPQISQQIKDNMFKYAQKQLINEVNKSVEQNRKPNIVIQTQISDLTKYVEEKAVQFQIFDQNTTSLVCKTEVKKDKQVQKEKEKQEKQKKQNKKEQKPEPKTEKDAFKEISKNEQRTSTSTTQRQQNFATDSPTKTETKYTFVGFASGDQKAEIQKQVSNVDSEETHRVTEVNLDQDNQDNNQQEVPFHYDSEENQNNLKKSSEKIEEVIRQVNQENLNEQSNSGWEIFLRKAVAITGRLGYAVIKQVKDITTSLIDLFKTDQTIKTKHKNNQAAFFKALDLPDNKIIYKAQKAPKGQKYENTEKFLDLCQHKDYWFETDSEVILKMIGLDQKLYDKLKKLYAKKIKNQNLIITVLTLDYLRLKEGRKEYDMNFKKIKQWVRYTMRNEEIDEHDKAKIGSLIYYIKQ